MVDIKPKHASLPLWRDQSSGQRATTLSGMFESLTVYATGQGIALPQIDIKDGGDSYESAKVEILSSYSDVLGQANSTLISQLKQAKPFDEIEARDVKASIDFISANPNAFNMNCESGHVTGSGLVIHPETSRVLLHRHKKLGIWLQFGGHSDFETDITQTAIREATEESGLNDLRLVSTYNDASIPLDIEIQKIAQKAERPEHYHYDMRFLFATSDPDNVCANEGESDDFWWLTIEQAQKMPKDKITPPVQRLISKAKSYIDGLPEFDRGMK